MSTNDNSLDFGDIVTDIENLDTDNTNLEENFEQLVQNVVFGDSPIAGIENLPPVENLPQVEINGQQFVIINGQQILLQDYLDAIQANGDIVIEEPEAQLSGGASASPFVLGSIGPDPDLTELLPPTALQFPVPEERELDPFVDEDDTPTLETEADVPSLFAGETQTPEAALPEGTSPADPGEVTTGDINIDTGNDLLGSLVVIDVNGNEVDVTNGGTVQGEYGILEVIVDANGEYSFEYTLTDNTIDHPEAGSVGTPEGVADSFDFIVTDDDGDTATDTLVIDILDDGPVAVDDSAATGEDQPITIDVFADDTEGADGVDVADITFDDTGTDGTVVYNGDGTFTFTPDPGFGGETTFTYTIIDADGDPSTATVTITVPEDSVPTLAPITGSVDEGGLAPDGTTASEDTEYASGNFAITTGDDTVGSLVIDGVDVTNGGMLTGDYGTLTVTLNSDGSYSWDYQLTTPEDHPTADLVDTADGIADIFDVELTDSDGDVVESTITIDVLDDGPISVAEGLDEDAVALVDESPLTEDGIAAATIDASTGFATEIYGADGAGSVEYALVLGDVNVGSGLYAIGANGAAGDEILLNESGGVITGSVGGVDYFTIEIDASTGEVTFTQLSNIWHADGTDADDASSMNVASGMLLVEQTVTDADGDTATSSFDIGGGVFIVEDDGPSADLTLANGAGVVVDETVGENAGEDESASLGAVTVAGSDIFVNASETGTDDIGATTEFSLNITNATTNLTAEGGLVVVLVDNNGVIEGHAGNATGTLIFTIEIDGATGDVTVTQLAALDHPDAADPDDAVTLLDGSLEGVVTVRDGDGDQDTDSVDLGGVITFEDDAPEVAVSLSGEDAVLDETDAGEAFINGPISTTTNGSVLTLDVEDYGSDGGSLAFAITGSGASGLQTADGDLAITLEQTSDTVISGTYNGGADTAFTIEIDPVTGELTVTQNVALEHMVDGDNSNGEHDDSLDLEGLITATATITDGDGDQDIDGIDIGGNIQFFDDGPSIQLTVNPAPVLVTDDDNIANPLTNNDSGSFADLFDIAFGADGAAAADSVDYDFAVNGGDGTDSGLNDALTGENILLRLNGDAIEGYLENSGDIAFTIAVDSTTGEVTQTQLRSIQHDDPTDSQETGADAESMAADLISLSLTVTDNDGDTASQTLDVGNSFTFQDAGPIAGGLVLATVDEDGLLNGVGDNAPGDIVSINTAQTLNYGFNVNFGEDGADVDDLVVSLGTVTTNDPSIGDVVLTSGGEIVQTSWDPATYTLTGFTSAGDVFTMVVNPDTDRAQFTLLAPLDHPSSDADGQNDGPDTTYEDDLRLTFEVTATDGDGDTVDRTIWIRVDDDSPIAVDDGNIDVVEGDTAGISGNVLTNDFEGADTATVTHIDLGSGFVAIDSGNDLGGGDYEHVTANGTYTINADGNWTFVASNGLAPGAVGSFDYRLTDGDGDAVEATQTITILDGAAPRVGEAIALQVDEDDLPDGSDTTPESLSDADSLTFTAGADDITSIVFSNDLSTLTADGDSNTAAGDISWVRVDDVTIEGSVDGQVVVTLELNAPASITNGTADTAEVTMTLSDEFDNLFGDNAETVLDLGYIGVVASEDDGDFITGDVILSVVDDVPTAEIALNPEVTLLVDESLGENLGEPEGGADGLGSVTLDGNFLFTDSSVLGADGGDVAYTLSVDGAVPTGLVDTASGENIVLSVNGDGTIITGSTEIGGAEAFTIEIDPITGNVTLTQQRALDHGDDGNDPDSVLTLANDAIALVATATDGDGDTDSDSVNFGGRIQFEDDGPSIEVSGADVPKLVTDDTDTPAAASDPVSVSFAGLFNATFGADGFKDTDEDDVQDVDAVSYAFELSLGDGTDSGLDDTLTGEDILLRINGDTIEGYLETSGDVAFTITLNADTGLASMEQDRAVDHGDDGNDHNAEIGLAANVISLTATVEDGDGDTAEATADISGAFAFLDDGPSIEVSGADVPKLVTDDTDTPAAASDPVSVSFAGLFNATFGADGFKDTDEDDVQDVDAVSYAFELSLGDGTDSGLDDTLTGEDILLRINGDTIEGYLETSGDVAFTITLNADTGLASMEQDRAVDHGDDGNDHNAEIGLAANVISLTATVEDGDGDTAEATADISGAFAFLDDGPSIEVSGADVPKLVTDDTDTPAAASDPVSVSFAGLFNATFGADGFKDTDEDDVQDVDAVSYAFELSLGDGTDSGLDDTLTGEDILLRINGDTIEGYLETSGDVAFTITLNADTGLASMEQDRAVDHGDDGNDHNAEIGLAANVISLTATVEDGDGDTAEATADISGAFAFLDDGPSIEVSGADVPKLVTDDTDTPAAASDPVSVSFAGLFNATFGADGFKDTDEDDVQDVDAVSYAFELSLGDGTDSGLDDTLTGEDILLRINGDTIEGYLETSGDVAFTITLNADTGLASMEQDRAVDHGDDGNDHNAEIGLAANVISLTATVEDGDGDTAEATADISGAFAFLDDGPSIEVSGADVPKLVTDDTDTPAAASDPVSVSFAGLFNATFGADGFKDTDEDDVQDVDAVSYAFELSLGDGTDSGLDDTLTGEDILLRINGDTIEGYLETSGDVAFTITLNADTGLASMEQDRAVDHGDDGNDHNAEIGLAANVISLTATVEDGDGDTAEATADISGAFAFLDDGPSIEVSGADVPKLVTDDTDTPAAASDPVSVSFAGLFNATFGADGFKDTDEDDVQDVDAVSYAFELSLGDGTDSGLDDTLTGEDILLRINGDTIEGYLETSGDVAFTITLNADTGLASMEQDRAVDHGDDGNDHNAEIGLAANVISLTATVEDGDGDTAEATADISGAFAFLDDGPSIEVSGADVPKLVTDDTDTPAAASDPVSVSFAGLFNATFGADGFKDTDEDDVQDVDAVSYAFELSLGDGTDSGLDDTLTGEDILLRINGDTIEGYLETSGDVAFTITLNADTGLASMEQDRAVDHGDDGNDHNAEIGLAANVISLTATVEDGDGDTAEATADISGAFAFLDDGPSIEVSGADVPKLVTDDTDTPAAASDPVSVSFAGLFNATFGADGFKDTDEDDVQDVDAVSYAFELSLGDGTDSGLDDTLTGEDILLRINGDTIEGYLETSGDVAFTITLNADTGLASMEQDRAVDHGDDGNDHNAEIGLAANVISLTATVEDGDGDTAEATADISGAFAFLDDGPSIEVSGADVPKLVTDDTDTPAAASDPVSVSFAGLFNATFGADGFKDTDEDDVQDVDAVSYAFELSLGDGTDSGLDDTLTGEDILLRINGDTIEGYLETSGDVAFTITLNADTGLASMEQDRAVDHGDDGNDHNAEIGLAANVISLTATVEDGDGDTAEATADISGAFAFLDDGPSIEVSGADVPKLVTDDTDTPAAASDPVSVSFAGLFNATFGADGFKDTDEDDVQDVDAVSYAFELSLGDGTDSGLDDTLTGEDILLRINGDTIEGYLETSGDVAFTITLNADTGLASMEQDRAVDHGDDGNDHNAEIGLAANVISLTATVEDGDGDTAEATADISGAFAFLDDGPSVTAVADTNEVVALDEGDTNAGSPASSIIAAIITGGIAIGNDPDVSGSGAISSGSSTDALVDITSLIYGADGVGTTAYALDVTALDSGLTTTDGSTINLIDINSDGSVIVGQVSGGTFNGEAAFAISINETSGIVTVEQYLSLQHPDQHDGSDTGVSYDETVAIANDALSVIVTVTDADGDIAETAAIGVGSQITFDDDGPLAINPDAIIEDDGLINASGHSLSRDLDDGLLSEHFGADGAGAVVFNQNLETTSSGLQSNFAEIKYDVSDDGQSLLAYTGDLLGSYIEIFTVTLNTGVDGDEYLVEMSGTIDSVSTIDFNDGGYDFVGGNGSWAGFNNPGLADSQDLLLTPIESGISSGTINANANEGGVSAGNSVGPDEGVRVDFVIDLDGSPKNGADYSDLANRNHTFDGHYNANGGSATFTQINTSSGVRMIAYDDDDMQAGDPYEVGDGERDSVTSVAISYGGETTVVSFVVDGAGPTPVNVGGNLFEVTFELIGGEYEAVVTGVVSGTVLSAFSDDGYNSLEFFYESGDTFKIGDFGVSTLSDTPVSFSIPVEIVDGDGDVATDIDSVLDITVVPGAPADEGLIIAPKTSAFDSMAEFTADVDGGEFGDMSMTRSSSTNMMDMAAMMTMVAVVNEMTVDGFEFSPMQAVSIDGSDLLMAQFDNGFEALAPAAFEFAQSGPLAGMGGLEPIDFGGMAELATQGFGLGGEFTLDGLAANLADINASDALENVQQALDGHEFDLGAAMQELPQFMEAIGGEFTPELAGDMAGLMPGLVQQLEGADLSAMGDEELLEAFFDNGMDGLLDQMPGFDGADNANHSFTSGDNGAINTSGGGETGFYSVDVSGSLDVGSNIQIMDDGHIMMLANSITGA